MRRTVISVLSLISSFTVLVCVIVLLVLDSNGTNILDVQNPLAMSLLLLTLIGFAISLTVSISTMVSRKKCAVSVGRFAENEEWDGLIVYIRANQDKLWFKSSYLVYRFFLLDAYLMVDEMELAEGVIGSTKWSGYKNPVALFKMYVALDKGNIDEARVQLELVKKLLGTKLSQLAANGLIVMRAVNSGIVDEDFYKESRIPVVRRLLDKYRDNGINASIHEES